MSKLYTVKQVAKMAGVSVRALHHYDAIGLLKPAGVGDNGYRYYGREELLRLQQICFYRELEFPLEAIATVLDRPGFDTATALRSHRTKLKAQARRYRRLLKTLDDTLAALEGEGEMKDEDLYKGFAPEKQAEYEDWLVDNYGDGMRARIETSKQAMKGWSKADWQAFQDELEANEAAIARAMADGHPPDGDAAMKIMAKHYAWVAKAWGRKPEAEAFKGLGQLYLSHPDFTARYEARAKGLAEYLAAAMAAYADSEVV
jgi:DNA-binding transcriptional MerR regulator